MSKQSDQVCVRIANNNRKIKVLDRQKKGITVDIKKLQLDSDEAITEFEESNVE